MLKYNKIGYEFIKICQTDLLDGLIIARYIFKFIGKCEPLCIVCQ